MRTVAPLESFPRIGGLVIMPPLILAAMVATVLFHAWVSHRRKFLVLSLKPIPLRAAIFAGVVAGFLFLKSQVETEFERVGSGVAFTPVSGIATRGPFIHTRFGTLP